MEILPVVYLAYMFITLYFLAMFLILYFKNRKEIFLYPESKRKYSVSFVVPAYNEGETIGEALNHIFNIDYDNIKEVIVVNDGSTDNTKEVLETLSKKYPNLKIINHKRNFGNAAIAQNTGFRVAKGELVVVVDADSYPARDSLRKMVGFFDDEKVGAVTCPVVPRNREKFIEKLQVIEYKAIAFSRKLLDYVDAIYVTPGPLAVYRRKALLEIKGFDDKNMTQDIEATWNLTYHGWERRMCLDTSVSSTVPNKISNWFKQRRRWNIGGLQCIYKYRKSLFNYKKGMLGFFIIPFFILTTFLGLLGLSIFFYLMARRFISSFLYTRYSIVAGTALVTLEDFYITPSVLNYLGVILFFAGLIFTLVVLSILKEKIFVKENLLNIPFYTLIYIAFYPFIMLASIFHALTGKRKWR